MGSTTSNDKPIRFEAFSSPACLTNSHINVFFFLTAGDIRIRPTYVIIFPRLPHLLLQFQEVQILLKNICKGDIIMPNCIFMHIYKMHIIGVTEPMM